MHTQIWYFCSYATTAAIAAAAAAAKSLQSCPTLCDPIDDSPPGSAVPGILQARTLEWVAISSSSAQKWKVKVKLLSRVPLLATAWTVAYQAPLSLGFSGLEVRCHCLLLCMVGFNPWVRKILWKRKWLPTPISFPREFHEQRSLVGYSPWGRKEQVSG